MKETKNSNKIALDKYYTNNEVVNICFDLIEEHIGLENITELVEPSAGSGAWLDRMKATGIEWKAYDIAPEHPEVIEQDFLELEMDYKIGRAIIGNPPFGRSNNLSRKFYNKAVGIADYIVFIQPISQLDNINSMFYFDLVKSVDLGKRDYSGRLLHCCVNIYKRPEKSIEAWKEKYPDYDRK